MGPDQGRGKEAAKAAREAGRAPAPGRDGALAGVSPGLPALARALKLQQKAGKVGFDWNDPKAVLAKIREEADEIGAELDAGAQDKVAGEIGDLLFAVVNLARHLDVDPETALRTTNLKFERRFGAIEDALAAAGKTPAEATLAEMDALWDQAKADGKEVHKPLDHSPREAPVFNLGSTVGSMSDAITTGHRGTHETGKFGAIPPGWIGGFAQSNPAFAYPNPDLSSLKLLGNMDNIDMLQRQQKVTWPEFSWETLPGNSESPGVFKCSPRIFPGLATPMRDGSIRSSVPSKGPALICSAA